MTINPIIKAVLMACAGTVLLAITYQFGSELAKSFGRIQRGGVAWGLALHACTVLFFIISFIQQLFIRLSQLNQLKITSVIVVIYTALSFVIFGNPFYSAWSHPYRYVYFMLISYCILIVPCIRWLSRTDIKKMIPR